MAMIGEQETCVCRLTEVGRNVREAILCFPCCLPYGLSVMLVHQQVAEPFGSASESKKIGGA